MFFISWVEFQSAKGIALTEEESIDSDKEYGAPKQCQSSTPAVVLAKKKFA